MLGESYKDAIASVEALDAIERANEELVVLVNEVEAALSARGDWEASAREAATSADARAGEDAEQGSRVKFLLDTPEKMWGLLEDCEYEAAATRLIAAQETLAAMTSGRKSEEALYAAFPVARQQATVLGSFKAHVSARARAGLERSNLRTAEAASALKALMVVENIGSSRALALLLQARQARTRACLRDVAASASTNEALKKRLAAIISDMKSILKMSFDIFAGSQPLIATSCTDSLTARDLFEGVFEPQAEWERFQANSKARASQLEILDEAAVRDTTVAWLDNMANDVSQRGGAVFGKISNCVDLAALETAFSSEDKEWDTACSKLFKRRVDLWSILFERPWLQQGFTLFTKTLTFAHLKPQVDTAIVDARKKAVADSRKDSSMWSSSSGSMEDSMNVLDDIKCARAVARAMNNIMLSVRKDALMLQGVELGGTLEVESRIAQIDQHIHSCAHRGLVEMAQFLSSKVESNSSDVPCALMVGHLARAVMDVVKEVHVLFKPASAWPKYNESSELIIKPARTLRGMQQPKEPQNVKIDDVTSEFKKAMDTGFSVWVNKCATDTLRVFRESFSSDESLASESIPAHWEDVVDDRVVGLQLKLPATPSSYLLTSIHGALQEAQRVGGHLLPRSAIRMLATSLVDGVLRVYSENLPRSRRSEKGTLQMLLDVKFAADVLALEDASRVGELQKQLTGTLDPIDWATYEPYLWENERRAYRRCSVLLGGFVQLADLYQDTSIKPVSAGTTAAPVKAVPRFTYLPVSLPTLRGLNSDKGKAKIDWGEIEAQVFDDEEREGILSSFTSFRNILREFA